MSATGPRLSVVVSTYQRRHRLQRLFDALDRQTLDPSRFEVVVVDDCSTDGTFEELERLAEGARCEVTVIRQEVNGGPARGRNTGWRRARGEIIAFTDDDCAPDPGWLEAGLAAMERGDVLVVGRTMPDPAQEGNRGPFSRTLVVNDTRFMQTCNVFYRRTDLEAVGGFDESIRAKGGEDTDLGWRVSDLGREVIFDASAVVLHDISPSSFRLAFRDANTWVDIPRVVAAHPARARQLMHRRIFWKKSHPVALLATAGIVTAIVTRRPALLVAAAPWLRFRVVRQPVARRRLVRLLLLPHVFVLDVTEIVTMARGSIRHRTVML